MPCRFRAFGPSCEMISSATLAERRDLGCFQDISRGQANAGAEDGTSFGLAANSVFRHLTGETRSAFLYGIGDDYRFTCALTGSPSRRIPIGCLMKDSGPWMTIGESS